MSRILLLGIALLIGGCGGGSSGNNSYKSSTAVVSSAMSSSTVSSSQSSANREFGLHRLNSLTSGVVYNSRLQAVNSLGYTVVGDIWITNGAEELLNGILVTPRIINFKECTGGCTGSNSLFPRVAWTFTYYIETTTGNVISFKQKNFFHDAVLDCRSVSPYQMPSVIKSGDAGVTPGFDCGAIMIEGNSWSASGKGSDQLVLSIKYKGYDHSGAIGEIEILYTLNAEGNIVSLTAGGLSTQVVN